MAESKQKDTQITTFPIPFSLETIPRNINITTNSLSMKTKEKLISEAFRYHSQGNILEALKYYEYFINQGFKDHKVFNNYGDILKNLGKLKEAELAILESIKIKPNYTIAYDNLGSIFKNLGKSKEAFDSYIKLLELDPTYSKCYNYLTILLRDSDPSKFDKSKLKNILNLLLEKTDLSHQDLFISFNFLYGNKLVNTLENFDKHSSNIEVLSNNKIVTNALKKILFLDEKLEIVLTKYRAGLSYRLCTNSNNINYNELQFIIALAQQCYLNDYVYSLKEEENKSINKIIDNCKKYEVNEAAIAILACYFPLYNVLDKIPNLKSFNSSNQNFNELIKLQIEEPLREIQLSKSIKKLGSINDITSQNVQAQYEKNPYPKWRYINNSKKQKTINQKINESIKPNYIQNDISNDQLKVLIAGCGTGQHMFLSRNYEKATITGIDLSLASLSYAQRKINEMKVNNIKLIQMDILKIELLEEKFDIIESIGVLHHMEDPLKALKKLSNILKPNGFLSLGLYSELARQDVVKAKNYIASKKLEPNEENIRNFRQKILSGELINLNSLKMARDFYSLSECRDMCFHTQEHRFNINQLEVMLSSSRLEFLGFVLPQPIKSLYQSHFPDDKKQTNLQNWAQFEEKHPSTFRGMYNFWVCKSKI